jgi:hypothetical protein
MKPQWQIIHREEMNHGGKAFTRPSAAKHPPKRMQQSICNRGAIMPSTASMRGAPEATRWQSIHPNSNDGKASIKEEQQQQSIRSDEPNDGGNIKQAVQNIAKMSLKRAHGHNIGKSNFGESNRRWAAKVLQRCLQEGP